MEMTLALSIAMILLLALYVTLGTQFRLANAGRDTIAEAALARNILVAIANDINGQLGAPDPRGWPTPAAPADPAMMQDPAAATDSRVTFNFGVRGDSSSIVLSTHRVQKPRAKAMDAEGAEVMSSMRRISYWMIDSGESSGLARHEIKQATGADVDVEPAQLPDPMKYLIAKEVKSIQFEYFDGLTWQGSWDGSQPAGESGGQLGPPSAIKITVTLRRMQNGRPVEGDVSGLEFQHVVALPTGNNFPTE